jgi:uncharacterized integral membrane protein
MLHTVRHTGHSYRSGVHAVASVIVSVASGLLTIWALLAYIPRAIHSHPMLFGETQDWQRLAIYGMVGALGGWVYSLAFAKHVRPVTRLTLIVSVLAFTASKAVVYYFR